MASKPKVITQQAVANRAKIANRDFIDTKGFEAGFSYAANTLPSHMNAVEYKGCIYHFACGSGGMIMQLEKFPKLHFARALALVA